uniref:Biotin carboxyl carrier protein of acetyl-CoA carboxylase n=1 Tax=Polysiphonia urceolata TaxID=173545 RepID=A0A1Z1MCP1_POLUR|nr:acetyl-CoA carboxylase biotin carboxyl carrier protein [Polysiphonia stricta]ARW63551.1 acetyl-CoA carboxylase biotin carboxyl carrier protein [Polysiphonia stricta]
MINIDNLKNFIDLIAKNDINNIKIEKDHTQIIINKNKYQQQTYTQNSYLDIQKDNRQNEKKQIDQLIINKKEKIQENRIDEEKIKHSAIYSTIISPMVGTFYKSPAPNELPFIEVGEIVKTKQAVCIIEAMKLMNEIESEVQGEVVEILVNDGDIVDCGQSLIKIKIK